MIDLFLQFGLSNACFSLPLAILAMLVGARAKRPHLAHLLWLLVFVKLVTPPIVTIPVVAIPTHSDVAITEHLVTNTQILESTAAASLFTRTRSTMLDYGRTWLPSIWLLGCVLVCFVSLFRVYRFHRLLGAESEVAPEELQTAAARIAHRLGVKRVPTICTTTAHLSPMVWWIGGKVRIVIPAPAFEQMLDRQWQWVLAHELAHVRRRDHWVRWLEWLACVLFWWNPVVWWAQRNLRSTEEICCDALVLSTLNPRPRLYANSLLAVVEFLAHPVLRPPAMASEINSGGFLERRFQMILSETPNRVTSRSLQVLVLLFAVVVIPLGLAQAQDSGVGGNAHLERARERVQAAVTAGKMSPEDAAARMEAFEAEQAERQARIDAFTERVQARVQAGEMTAGEAITAIEGFKKRTATSRERRSEVDWEAIHRRIEAAVESGQMTREEADQKYREIRERRASHERHSEVDWEAIHRRIEAAVESGEMTREEANAKHREIRERMASRERHGEVDWEAIQRRIEGAVESGQMTREEADAKYREIRENIASRERRDAPSYEDVAKRIRAAIEAGEITPEQGRERLAAYRERMASRERHGEVDWAGIRERIEGAVEAGQMTREEADAKYREIRERRASHERHGEVNWRAIQERIEAAVESGEMTREEANAKHREIRERIAARERHDAPSHEDVAERIRAAIEAGEITPEQGRERLAGFRERMAQEHRRGEEKRDRADRGASRKRR